MITFVVKIWDVHFRAVPSGVGLVSEYKDRKSGGARGRVSKDDLEIHRWATPNIHLIGFFYSF